MNKSETVAIIRSLLSSTKYNVSVGKLNIDFKKETGFDIPFFGYNNLSDFLQSIPDTVRVSGIYPIQKVSLVRNEKSAHIVSLVHRTRAPEHKKNAYKGRYRTAAVNSWKSQVQKSPNSIGVTDVEKCEDNDKSTVIKSNSTNCLTNSLESSDSEISLKNFVKVGEKIPTIDIKLHAKVGEYVEVVPEYIYSPHKFYFHFRKFKKKFAALVDKLQIFYEKHENIREVADSDMEPTLMCAVFHKIKNEPMWHRVEIKEIVSKSYVIVTFVDYGCRAEVSKVNLKYLHGDFKSLPKQAVLGSLANIKPSKGKFEWSWSAVERFETLALQEDLLAGVVALDAEECSMKVALTCTKGLEFHINDTLVQEGYAEFESGVLNNYSSGVLNKSISRRSWKTKVGKTGAPSGKIDFTKEGALQLMAAQSSPALETPIFYFSSTFSGNKRLQKMFSVA